VLPSKSDAYESFPDAEIARVLELLRVLLLTAFSQLPCAFPIHFLHLHAALSLHLDEEIVCAEAIFAYAFVLYVVQRCPGL